LVEALYTSCNFWIALPVILNDDSCICSDLKSEIVYNWWKAIIKINGKTDHKIELFQRFNSESI
jgi:hypothetical protein